MASRGRNGWGNGRSAVREDVGMDDLLRWLGEQLDEEERIARMAGGAPWEASVPGMVHVSAAAKRESRAFRRQGYVAVVERVEHQHHIVAHDPARVLREVDAKRRLIRELL